MKLSIEGELIDVWNNELKCYEFIIKTSGGKIFHTDFRASFNNRVFTLYFKYDKIHGMFIDANDAKNYIFKELKGDGWFKIA